MFESLMRRLAPAAVWCPFCGRELNTQANPQPQCVRWVRLRQNANENKNENENDPQALDVDFTHDTSPPPGTGWSQMCTRAITAEYIKQSQRGRARSVSIVGDTHVGKTVWMLALGSLLQHPGPEQNHLSSAFLARLQPDKCNADPNTAKMIDDVRQGLLPLPTPTLRQILVLPFWLRPLKTEDGRLFVIKDIGGETPQMVPDIRLLLASPDAQHLFNSRWLIIMLDARDKLSLFTSLNRAGAFLDLLKDGTQGHPPQHGVVVTLARVDQRSQGPDDRLRQAVAKEPNVFRIALDPQQGAVLPRVDMPAYLAGMREVQEEARAEVRRVAPSFQGTLEGLFAREHIYYAATSSLGIEAAKPTAQHPLKMTVEDIAVAEPACIRVLDPVLWMLWDEKVLRS